MRQRMCLWWTLRTTREQQLLLVMAALFAIVLAWLLILRPIGDALAEARGRHQRAVIALGEANADAETIARLERIAPPPPDIPINVFVEQQASAAGFTIDRIEPQGSGGVTVAMAAVRPQAFFGWAAGLERQSGLVVDKLSARANTDRTLAIEATFRARSR